MEVQKLIKMDFHLIFNREGFKMYTFVSCQIISNQALRKKNDDQIDNKSKHMFLTGLGGAGVKPSVIRVGGGGSAAPTQGTVLRTR